MIYGSIRYLVKWKDTPEVTWQTPDDLANSPDVLANYNGSQAGPSRPRRHVTFADETPQMGEILEPDSDIIPQPLHLLQNYCAYYAQEALPNAKTKTQPNNI
ncbi:hypothetical protein BGZ76_006925, partial [Entomortierella beljakovae]